MKPFLWNRMRMSAVRVIVLQFGKLGLPISSALRILLLVAIVIALSAGGLAARSGVEAAVTASATLSSSAYSVDTGQTFTVNISLGEVSNLYAAEAHVAFDKVRLQVVDPDTGQPANHIQAGTLLAPSLATGIAVNRADNSAGTIDYAVTLTGDTPVSGTGALATISFKAIAQGTATVLFKNPVSSEPAVKLADVNANDVSVGIQSTPVNISVGNSPPVLANVTASQGSGTGTVNITYDLSDATETSANVSFQFWNGTLWTDCQSTTGEGSTSVGTGKSGTWNAKADFDNQYSTGIKIKVIADDGQSIDNLGNGEGAAFTLDTKAPTNVGCSTPQNAAASVPTNGQFTALTAADDSSPISYQFRLAEDQAFTSGMKESDWLTSNAWFPGDLGYSKTFWWAVQARDAFGNSSGWSSAFSFTTVSEGGVLAQETISPTSETTVATEDGSITIEVPAGAVTAEAELVIRERSCTDTPEPPSGYKVTGNCFSIEMTQDLATGVMVTIVVKYSDADVEAAGGDANLLKLAYYDEEAEDWVVLDTTVDTANKTLTAQTDHFSTWSILAKTKGGGPPAWIWIVIGLGVVLVATASVLWLRHRRLATAPSVRQGTSDQSRGGN